MMLNYFLLFALLLFGKPGVTPIAGDKPFTIYLIRHAEKDLSSKDPSNPELTSCGQQRAENLQLFFKTIDLKKVYSTNFIRTQSTARPTAQSKGLEITPYDADRLSDFANQLIENKEDALVVGHSNTTAVLAGILAGEELGDIDPDVYNRIYQVTLCGKSSKLQLFHSSFACPD